MRIEEMVLVSGLWGLFDPVYTALAKSRPPSVVVRRSTKDIELKEWSRDLILAYRNVHAIKLKLLKEFPQDESEGELLEPLRELL